MYQNWPVYLYVKDKTGKEVEKQGVDMKISSVLPDEEVVTENVLPLSDLPGLLEKGYRLAVGIEDPMTGTPCVRFAMDTLYKDGKNYLW